MDVKYTANILLNGCALDVSKKHMISNVGHREEAWRDDPGEY